jgi:endonuclease/exonuclease/phosphatase family metal-dependent hydrolase
MKFSFLSWNVEHFRGGGERLNKVAKHIKDQNPDIFGLLEIEGADILSLMQNKFSTYDFALTDGPEVQEILVGWRRNKFSQAIFTQKREFKAFNPSLRPGALLTVTLNSVNHNLLFLHTDSGVEAPDFGNRSEMFEHGWKLKKAIDKIAGGPGQGHLIILGDLNTMGLQFPTPKKANTKVDAQAEIAALATFAGQAGMRLLPKDLDVTWKGSQGESNLDHVLASNALQFGGQGTTPAGQPASVAVRGWNQLSGEARKKFLAEISDHSSLFAEVI